MKTISLASHLPIQIATSAIAVTCTAKRRSTMKFTLRLALVPLLALLAVPVIAQDCDKHHIIFKMNSFAWLDVPLAPYDLCWELKMVGTINGRFIGCVYGQDICGPYGCYGRTSQEIYGDGWTEVASVTMYGRYELKNGVFETQEWIWRDTDSGMEAGIAKIVGGAGAFEGAIGFFSGGTGYPNSEQFHFKGQICGVDDDDSDSDSD